MSDENEGETTEGEQAEEKIRKMHEPNYKIQVEHKFEKGKTEPDSVAQENEELKEQLGLIALKSFEDDKKALLEKIEDPNKKEYVEQFIGEDPQKLEQIKFLSGVLGQAITKGSVDVDINEDGTEKIPPSGKATALNREKYEQSYEKQKIDQARAVIDQLFDVLTDCGASPEEKKQADRRITELYQSAVEGWRKSGRIIIPQTMQCPKCSEIMTGNECESCGYAVPKEQRSRGR